MQSAVDLLVEDLNATELQLPNPRVLHNIDATVAKDTAELKQKLVRQLINPLQWVKTVEAIKDQGIRTIVECGPGRVLSGLNRAIDKELNLPSLGVDMQGFNQAVSALKDER